MQAELQAERPDLAISLLAVNAPGLSDGNEDTFAAGSLPLMQDDDTAQVWDRWNAEWRDVQVVDAENHVVQTYNLTENDLGVAENYDTLKAMLIDAAEDGR
jgi:hypothetical protein